MNPVQKAIADVKFKIPMDILMAAFVRREFGMSPLPVNIDTLIREQVIEPKVLVDCNLVGGNEVLVPLGGIQAEYVEPRSMVYRIPKSLTQNRAITRVISMNITSGNMAGGHILGASGQSQLLDAAAGVMAAQASIPIVSTAYLRLIAENTVLLTDNLVLPSNIHLRCYIENDKDLSQMRSTTIPKFSRLVEYAVKAYIYNQLILPMGQAQLVGGMELGRFREVVDSYADAAELYDTYLEETWRRVAIFDDTLSRERHLRMIVGGQR